MVGRTKVGGVEIEIRGDADHFEREMRGTKRTTERTHRGIRSEIRRTGTETDKLNAKIRQTGASMVALAATVGLGFTAGIGVLKNFGQAMSTLKAVTGATDAQMDALTAKARLLGSTTRFSGTQAAEGMIYLARAGYTADEALNSVEGTLKLAQAGGLDLGRAADIASNVLGGFNKNVSETGRVVDVLAKAANSANVTVNSLGEGLKFAAPVADSLGISLEETVAIIGKLGDSGIAGGLGGRGFSGFAVAFEARRKEIEAIIGEYDIASEGFNNVIRRLRAANVETSRIVQLFGAANLDIYTILANSSVDAAKGTEVLTKKLKEAAGTADTVSRIMDDNLNGAILGAISAMQEVVLALGDAGGTSGLIAAFNGLADLMRTAAANADILGVAFVALAARGILPLAIASFSRAVPALIAAKTQLTLVSAAAGAATLATSTLSAAVSAVGGPLTIAIAAAATAYVALARSARDAKQDIADTNEAIARADEVIRETGEYLGREDPMNKIGEGAKEAKNRVDDLAASLGDVATRLKQVFEAGKLNQAFEVAAAAQELRNEIAKIEEEIQTEAAQYAARQKFFESDRAPIREARLEELRSGERGDQQRRARQRLAVLEGQFKELGVTSQDLIKAFREGAKDVKEEETPPAKSKPVNVAAGDPKVQEALEELAAQEALLEELERAYQLDLARAQEREKLVQALEDEEDIIARTADYMEAGLTQAEAERKAREEILSIREAERDVEEEKARIARLNRDFDKLFDRGGALNPDEEDFDFETDTLKRDLSLAIEEAIRSGNVGEAIRNVFERRVSDALGNAIESLVDEVIALFSGVFKDSGAGGDIFGIFGTIFSGARASGGSVKKGQSYLVGERGAERFVPLEDGTILPNMNGQKLRSPDQMSRGAIDASFNNYGTITEEALPRMLELLQEHQRRLPQQIDARFQEQRSRGAYD